MHQCKHACADHWLYIEQCRQVHTHTHTYRPTQKLIEKDQLGQNECQFMKIMPQRESTCSNVWSSLQYFVFTCFWISITYSSLCGIQTGGTCGTQTIKKVPYKISQSTWKQKRSIKQGFSFVPTGIMCWEALTIINALVRHIGVWLQLTYILNMNILKPRYKIKMCC